MVILIIAVIVVGGGILFFRYCENIGAQMEEYQNREPEWNPPRPPKPRLADPNSIPYKSGSCANCKYCYTGTKTEYWYDERELKGKSETTRYLNWCLVHQAAVESEVGYRLNEVHHCGMFDAK